MAFIGNTNTTQAFTPAIDYFSGNGSTTAFTLSRPVASVAQVQAVVNNVAQNPSSAYTVSGNTITFTSAPSSGTNNIYVYYTSPITQVIAPSQGTVGTTQLQNGLTVNFADGTAAAPSITNDGDTNTGIFFPAADTIAFSEGGVEVMRITSAGGVSFGATGTAYGTSGQVLTSAGNASPTWTTTAPVFGRVVRTSGSVSTTSTSLVDLTGASITLTTGAFPVHISFAGSWYNDTDNQALYINVDIDGALELGTNGIIENDTFNYEANASFSIDSAVLTAASHTFKIKWRVSAGTGVILGSSTNAYNFSVHEIK